jgi:hypothetical protein
MSLYPSLQISTYLLTFTYFCQAVSICPSFNLNWYDYKKEYARGASIEGTLSKGVRAYGLRRTQYVGLAKTHLQHLMTATAINLKRIFNWLLEIPQATTRTSRYAKLMSQSTG